MLQVPGPSPGPEPDADRDRRQVRGLSLDVSGACNLRCTYCVEAGCRPRGRPMSVHTADLALRLLSPGPGTQLRFVSGEPLTNERLLRRIGDRVRSQPHPVPALHLTTNGTLVTERTADWLADQGWSVKVSIDGPAPIHDRHRRTAEDRGSFSRAIAGLKRLLARSRDRTGVAAVLCRGTDPAAGFNLFCDLGVSAVEFAPVAHRDPALWPSADDVGRYERFVFDYARRYLAGERLPRLIRLFARVVRVMGYDGEAMACGAGRSMFGVDGQGGLFPCFRFLGLPRYRVGNVYTGIDERAAAAFCRGPGASWVSRAACAECWAASACGGPCFAGAELFGPGGGQPFFVHCSYAQIEAATASWLVTRLVAADPTRLLDFLPSAGGVRWLPDHR